MVVRRFYTPLKRLRPGIRIYLPEDESNHITKVFRKKQGDTIEVFNGDEVYQAEIFTAAKDAVRVKLLKRINTEESNEPLMRITLMMSLVKLPRLELAIQKAVELGVDDIIVYNPTNSAVNTDIYNRKLDRLAKIVIEACKQSKSTKAPQIQLPITFSELTQLTGDYDKVLLLTTELPGHKLTEINWQGVENLAYVIGPEGGFTSAELKLAQENKWEAVKFGPHILKSETAAIGVLSVLQALKNNY